MSDRSHIYGEVPFEILQAIGAMRERYDEILLEVGRLELLKSDLLEEARGVDRKSRDLLNQEAKRLGIPAGAPWQMTPEGVAIALPVKESK